MMLYAGYPLYNLFCLVSLDQAKHEQLGGIVGLRKVGCNHRSLHALCRNGIVICETWHLFSSRDPEYTPESSCRDAASILHRKLGYSVAQLHVWRIKIHNPHSRDIFLIGCINYRQFFLAYSTWSVQFYFKLQQLVCEELLY
jgi:hypothetical protein